jgi:hypothetical protein
LVDADAADLTRIRGTGRPPMEELERGCCCEAEEGAVGVDEKVACLGREERLSFRTTIAGDDVDGGSTKHFELELRSVEISD